MPLKKASEIQSAPVILMVGAPKTGKTSTVGTLSKNAAGIVLPHKGSPIDCSDVVILQNDVGGHEGALDSGLCPSVIDFSRCKDWLTWEALFNKELPGLRQACAEGKITAVAIDLTRLDALIQDQFVANAATDSPKNWTTVTQKAGSVFSALLDLPGQPIVVGMVHPTVKSEMTAKAEVIEMQRLARDAMATEGERQAVVADLTKGHSKIWVNNATVHISLQPKKTKAADGSVKKEYRMFIDSKNKIEAGSRWFHRLGPGPHAPNLRDMLNKLIVPA